MLVLAQLLEQRPEARAELERVELGGEQVVQLADLGRDHAEDVRAGGGGEQRRAGEDAAVVLLRVLEVELNIQALCKWGQVTWGLKWLNESQSNQRGIVREFLGGADKERDARSPCVATHHREPQDVGHPDDALLLLLDLGRNFTGRG